MKDIKHKEIGILKKMLYEAKYPVVLTGAGMSTESGVPDFRSKDGWWRKINPAEVASVNSLNYNYDLFREFYKHRIKTLEGCRPNGGHDVLAGLESRGLIKALITQNIDGFHYDAGSKNVYELHGSINNIFCSSCCTESNVSSFLADCTCLNCGGNLRPGVILFGEGLPQNAWAGAHEEIEKSDLMIVIGTSLNVSPVNSLPFISPGKKVLINLDDTIFNDRFDLVIKGKSGEVLTMLDF